MLKPLNRKRKGNAGNFFIDLFVTRDYLDTEFDPATLQDQNKRLSAIGIDHTEFQKISKEIRWILFGTWEWTYLGLWDVLAMKQYRNPFYRFYGKSWYWKLMRIGLRGSE